MDIFVGILGAGVGAGLMQIINTIVNHKIKANEQKDERIDAMMEALKVMMIDRIHYIVSCHVRRGYVTLDEKETLYKMYKAFKGVGGNGDCDVPMAELEKLPVREE